MNKMLKSGFLRKIILVSVFILLVYSTFAQTKIWNNWYFGNKAGLSFNTEPPTVLIDGQMNAGEGCASISDENGNLLFYSDGISVWDKNHDVMPNGTGLMGSFDSYVSAFIVPKPQSNNLYYIFTTEAIKSKTRDARFSILDMSLNGGNGDVVSTEKNIIFQSNSTEALEVILHANQKDYWIIVNSDKNNKLYCYLLTKDGLNTTPVSSYTTEYNRQIRSNNAGNKLIVINSLSSNKILMLNFDNANGMFTYDKTIELTDGFSYMNFEFSPDDSKLYVLVFSDLSRILQFDMVDDFTKPEIVSTATKSFYFYLDIKTAPNGKMYIIEVNTGNKLLSVINNPNLEYPNCNIEKNVIDLSPGKFTTWFPNTVKYTSCSISVNLGDDITVCQGETVTLDAGVGFDSYLWSTGETTQTISVSKAGDYFVEIELSGNLASDTVSVSFQLPTPTVNKQAAIWYFGDKAGLDFNTEPPTVLTNSAMSVSEGSAVLADENGNLLCYTDGKTIWDRNHSPFPNGDLFSGGTPSQAAVFVPFPNHPNQFFLFIEDGYEMDAESRAFKYNIIDMTLNNGYGDVVTGNKDIVLNSSCSEQMTSVSNVAQSVFWIIDFYIDNDNYLNSHFKIYKVDENGVNPDPIKIPVPQTAFVDMMIKVSPDGKKIAWPNSDMNYLFTIADFDVETGNVSNITSIKCSGYKAMDWLEYSPNSKYLYLNGGDEICQFDISKTSADDILASKNTIINKYQFRPYQMQLAPNGKIYIAHNQQKYLSVINEPNNYGADVNLSIKDFYLEGSVSHLGLPSFCQSYLIDRKIVNKDSCSLTQKFTLIGVDDYLSVNWNFGDEHSITDDTLVQHTYSSFGKYNVSATINTVCGNYTLNKNIALKNCNVQIIANNCCLGNSVLFLINDLVGIKSWLWNFGDGQTSTELSPNHVYENAGKYNVTLKLIYIDSATETIVKEIEIYEIPEKPVIRYDKY